VSLFGGMLHLTFMNCKNLFAAKYFFLLYLSVLCLLKTDSKKCMSGEVRFVTDAILRLIIPEVTAAERNNGLG